mgnify:FL=1
MKKNKKMFRFILVFVALIAILFPSYSKALSDIQIYDSVEVADVDLSWKAIKDGADTFIKKGEKTGSVDDKKVQNIVIPIAQILVAAGNIVVVIAVVVMGIKYMVANPEDRAKLKSQLVGLAVATCVIFGAQFIWKICYSLFSTL